MSFNISADSNYRLFEMAYNYNSVKIESKPVGENPVDKIRSIYLAGEFSGFVDALIDKSKTLQRCAKSHGKDEIKRLSSKLILLNKLKISKKPDKSGVAGLYLGMACGELDS